MRQGIRVGRPTERELNDLLTAAAAGDVTYDHLGSTVDPGRWPERPSHQERVLLGRGRQSFEAAGAGLRRWVCHRGIGAAVHPVDAVLRTGESLLVILRVGPVRIVVPNRIVAVVDEPARFGFAYGTLPGHHERGEEAFLVDIDPDGAVWGTVRVDAVPATAPARVLAPAVGSFQRVAVHRYLGALARSTREPVGP